MVESISDGLDGGNTASAIPDDAGGDLKAGLYLVKLNGNFGFSGIVQQSKNSQGNEWQWIFNESIEIPGGATSDPVVAGGVLYVVSSKGQLHAFR